MNRAVSLSVQVVASAHCAQEAGISLQHHRGGAIDTPPAISNLVRQMDELQYHFDDGPCVDAIRDSETAQSPRAFDAENREHGLGIAAQTAIAVAAVRSRRLMAAATPSVAGGSVRAGSARSRSPLSATCRRPPFARLRR
jgi:hypothetical protein